MFNEKAKGGEGELWTLALNPYTDNTENFCLCFSLCIFFIVFEKAFKKVYIILSFCFIYWLPATLFHRSFRSRETHCLISFPYITFKYNPCFSLLVHVRFEIIEEKSHHICTTNLLCFSIWTWDPYNIRFYNMYLYYVQGVPWWLIIRSVI